MDVFTSYDHIKKLELKYWFFDDFNLIVSLYLNVFLNKNGIINNTNFLLEN